MLHYLPYSRELLFQNPHWRTDGRGICLLQHVFCTLLASEADTPVFDGSEAKNLPPSFSQLAGLTDGPATPEMSQDSDAVLGTPRSSHHTGKPCSIEFKEHADFDAVADYLSAYYGQDLQPLYSHMVDYHQKIGRILSAPMECLMSLLARHGLSLVR
jgi:hypothetical protein